MGTACAIALALTPAAARSSKLEAAYVVLGGEGAVARAILSDATQCPAITIDNATAAMHLRASPQTGGSFPVAVCDALLPPGTVSAAIEGRPLPVPRPSLGAIAVLGDTGCRLKAYKQAARKDDHDHPDAGQFQDCDRRSKWPFSQMSKAITARKPDLVIHIGDYVYRESPCPKGDRGCKGSPYGDNWLAWQADFFKPAAALLASAPWIAIRGNHEICERAGAGYFRFLDPSLAKNGSPPACTDLTPVYTATVAGRSFIIMDTSNADDGCKNGGCDSAPYAAQFAGLPPVPGSLFVSHRPIWGIGRNFELNQTLQRALAEWEGKLPPGIDLALSGHMHMFEILSFEDGRSPQLIVGTGGTKLDRTITRRLEGTKLGGTVVSHGRALREFGFIMLMPRWDASGWTATFVTGTGRAKLACSITPAQARCGRPGAAR